MKKILTLALLLPLAACAPHASHSPAANSLTTGAAAAPTAAPSSSMNEGDAITLAAYPLACLDHPEEQSPLRAGYLWQPAGSTSLLPGYDKQRAFYGCYDWHSAVNATWTLVTLLRLNPGLSIAPLIREKLNDHLGKSNLEGELAYFQKSKAFERPYGQAWLLKLYGELLAWKDPDAQKWAANLAPLVQFFSKNLASYLTTLPTPVRQGVHPNTAFSMGLMLPYTAAAHDDALHAAIVSTAHRFYDHDLACPTAYEPEGVSFLSPCLVEAALMSRLLPQPAYVSWLDGFLPDVHSAAFRPLTTPFDASHMTKDQMAGQSHLIGLAFSRAAAMDTIARALPAGDPRATALEQLAALHAQQGFRTMTQAGYLETHWIAAYAVLYQLAAPPSRAVRAAVSATP